MNARKTRHSPAIPALARYLIAVALLVIIGLIPADAAARRLTTMTANDQGKVTGTSFTADSKHFVYMPITTSRTMGITI
ncbi:hypothetical protein HC891_21890 [Candidatus Gracilibacteria bacterium]|nr:hypothetical protein [Candidatus Gracilibacteria bacterium]